MLSCEYVVLLCVWYVFCFGYLFTVSKHGSFQTKNSGFQYSICLISDDLGLPPLKNLHLLVWCSSKVLFTRTVEDPAVAIPGNSIGRRAQLEPKKLSQWVGWGAEAAELVAGGSKDLSMTNGSSMGFNFETLVILMGLSQALVGWNQWTTWQRYQDISISSYFSLGEGKPRTMNHGQQLGGRKARTFDLHFSPKMRGEGGSPGPWGYPNNAGWVFV